MLVWALPGAAASTWAATGSMHSTRAGATAAVLGDGRVLVVGGERGAARAELYNPRTRAWTAAPDPPAGFGRDAAAFRLGNGRVFLIAPAERFRQRTQPPRVTSFDSELGWLEVPDPPPIGGDGYAVAQAGLDDVLVAGGNALDGPVKAAVVYTARANAWTALAPLPAARSGARAAPLGGGVVLVAGGAGPGGLDQAPLDTAAVYTGAAGWRPAASFPGLAATYQLLALGGGRALAVMGGGHPGLAVYDAATDHWTAGPPPPYRGQPSALALPDGRVLFAGGTTEPSAAAGLFDPVGNSWSSLQPMSEPRLLPILVDLAGGGVLSAGGFGRSGPLASAEIFGGPPAPPGEGTPKGSVPQAGWIAAGLVLLGLGLVGLLGLSRRRRPAPVAAGLSRLALQLGGVVVLTWGLFAAAHLLQESRSPGGAIPAFFSQPLGQVLLEGTSRSLVLIGFATLGATFAGLGAAITVVSLRERRLLGLELAGAVLLVLPTFLIAILVQELQAVVFGRTGLVVAAGYGEVNNIQVFWASLVLGIRPAIYLYRHARAVLERESSEDYVRTAEAKGLDWNDVVRHHLVRAGGSSLVATWTNSFRLMIGSLPLVEYFFGYPGLGRILVQSIGIHYGVRPVVYRGDLAIGLVVVLALILILVETAAGGLQRWFDPRLRTLRAAA